MKYIQIIFILIFFRVPLLGQTIISGTPGQIFKYQIASGAKEVVQSALNLKRSKNELEASIKDVRSKFWTQYSQGKVQADVQKEYIELLNAKDMYMMLLEMQNFLYKATGGQPGSVLSGPKQAIEYIGGGKLDGGIDKFAYLEWNSWRSECGLIFEAELTKSRASEIQVSMEKALLGSFDRYTLYQQKRDLAEYLFMNPFSGLLSTSSEKYFESWLLATGTTSNLADAQKILAQTREVSSSENFTKMVRRLKSNINFSINNLHTKQSPNYSLSIAEWYLTESDQSLVPYYFIKRKNGCSWTVAKKIHQIRVSRHGQVKINTVLSNLNLNGIDQSQGCIGDPEILFANQNKNKKFLSFNDCIADNLNGQAELWQDAYEVAISEMDKIAVRKKIIEQVVLALVKDPTIGISPESVYQELVTFMDEKLLLAAYYNQLTYGDGQIKAEWPEMGRKEYLESTEAKLYFSLRILEGFAIEQKSYRTFGVLTLWSIDPFGKSDTDIAISIIKATQKYKTLEAQYGGDKMIDASKRLMPKSLGAYYPRRLWSANDLTFILQKTLLPETEEQNIVEEKFDPKNSLREKYKTVFAKYTKSSNSQGKIFEDKDMAIFLRECASLEKSTDNAAKVNIYFKSDDAYIASNTDEHVVRAQELFVPILRLHCPFLKEVFISYYKQGLHVMKSGYGMSDKEFEEKVKSLNGMKSRTGTKLTEQEIRDSLERPLGTAKISIERGNIKVCHGCK